jgi:2-polyprenyl-3-methyl-5-hydroxy-6-metoxy-1,4-benzoquinol methylase
MICSFCGKKVFKNIIEKYSKAQDKKINYFQCSFCYSLHQYPIPDKKILKKYYDSYIETKKEMNPGYLENYNLSSLFIERDTTFAEIGFKKKMLKKTTNVEFGCANGQFLNYLKKNNAENIIGIDISKQLISSIKMQGVKLILGDLNKLKPKSIDNLFMFNILEHIPDIKSLMNKIISTVKNTGKIIIEVPLTGIISKTFNKNWRFLMPDEHLHIPSLKGLKILLKKNGLIIIGKTRFGSGYTTGMIPLLLKNIFDKFAKFFSYGDRGAFLIIFKKIN